MANTLENTISENNGIWRIKSPVHKGRTYELLSSPLDGEVSRTQDEWAKIRIEAEKRGGFYTPTFPEFYDIVSGIKQGSKLNPEAGEKARVSLRDLLRKNLWSAILTRIIYSDRDSEDTIVQGYGLQSPEFIKIYFKGRNENLRDARARDNIIYQRLLGTDDDLNEIRAKLEGLNETDVLLCRFFFYLPGSNECVAGFYANSHRAALTGYRNPVCSYSSLGIRVLLAQNSEMQENAGNNISDEHGRYTYIPLQLPDETHIKGAEILNSNAKDPHAIEIGEFSLYPNGDPQQVMQSELVEQLSKLELNEREIREIKLKIDALIRGRG